AADTMPQSIFNQRLQDQTRHECPGCIRINIEHNLQPIGESHLLDVQIELQETDLLPQFHLLLGRVFQHTTQKITQANQHANCRVILIVAHQPNDAVQSVKEKMRM